MIVLFLVYLYLEFLKKQILPKKHSSLSDHHSNIIMTKRIEEELVEINRLKRLELEFLFFRAGIDNTLLKNIVMSWWIKRSLVNT